MNPDVGKFIGPALIRRVVPIINGKDVPSYLPKFQILKAAMRRCHPHSKPRRLVVPIHSQVFDADIGSRLVYRNNDGGVIWLDDDRLVWSAFDSRHLSRRASTWRVVEALIIRSTLDNKGISGGQTGDALRNCMLGR